MNWGQTIPLLVCASLPLDGCGRAAGHQGRCGIRHSDHELISELVDLLNGLGFRRAVFVCATNDVFRLNLS
jgi:hypothetical protein